MKINEDLKTYLYVLLFFSTVTFISFFMIEPKKATPEEVIQLTKDSILNEYYKKELDSNYIFEHSKIEKDTNGK